MLTWSHDRVLQMGKVKLLVNFSGPEAKENPWPPGPSAWRTSVAGGRSNQTLTDGVCINPNLPFPLLPQKWSVGEIHN